MLDKLLKYSVALLALAAVDARSAVISGTGELTGTNQTLFNGVVTVDETFTDDTTPVSIDERASISGLNQTGTTLGSTKVFGNDLGFFNLGVFGQANHDHLAAFQFEETITNTGAADQNLTLDFLISAGELSTRVLEVAPAPSEFQEAGYEISISFGGVELFSSGATVRQVGVTDFSSDATLTTSGVDLGGTFTEDDFLGSYTWEDFTGTLDLGVLAAGASGLLAYDVRTFVTAEFDMCGSSGCGQTRSRIGDPFDVSGDPLEDASAIGPAGIGTGQPPMPVPEPGPLGLVAAGLLALVLRRRGFERG